MIRLVSVEGNIGSGKSTFLNYVKQQCAALEKVIILAEPVNEWETLTDSQGSSIIELFYHDKEKYAFPFQMMAYISRLALLKKARCGDRLVPARCWPQSARRERPPALPACAIARRR